MNLRQAAALALEALEGWDNYGDWLWPESALDQAKRNTTESLAALRAALAEADDRKCTCHPDDNPPQPCPKQFALGECRQAAALAEAKEPVAWLRKNGFRFLEAAEPQDDSELPLYTHPPRREALTEEQIDAMSLREAAEKALEALEITTAFVDGCPIDWGRGYVSEADEAINALRAALAEAEEPVAWHYEREGESAISFSPDRDPYKPWQPLYTHPPRREPVAWRTEAARWLRRKADDAELESERTGWANPARHMPDTFRRIADDLEAEQEAAPYGLDCSPETRREPLSDLTKGATWEQQK